MESEADDVRARSADRVYEEVRMMAMTYAFRPGERINEAALARRLEVSRTPLREALNRLAAEGFLTSAQNRGFVGRLLDATEIHQLYEFRCELEQVIARLACARATEAEIADLARMVAQSRHRPDERPQLQDLRDDEAFHVAIARTTRNAEFVRALESVNARIHFVRWIDMRIRAPAIEGHGAFVELLAARDADGCAEHMRRMIRRRYDEIVDVIRTGIADIYVGAPSDLSNDPVARPRRNA